MTALFTGSIKSEREGEGDWNASECVRSRSVALNNANVLVTTNGEWEAKKELNDRKAQECEKATKKAEK